MAKEKAKKAGLSQEIELDSGISAKIDGHQVVVEKGNEKIRTNVNPSIDVVASIRSRLGSWPVLDLFRVPDYVVDGLGVLVAKKFSSGNVSSNLERRAEV